MTYVHVRAEKTSGGISPSASEIPGTPDAADLARR